jgi:serine phosphatase RsbU (regulator of sigma subunit)
MVSGTESNQSTILIVDDEDIVITSLKSFLILETDYQIITKLSPDEALEFLDKNQVDLVISDFLMPKMNGVEFLSRVKKIFPEVPLILLTGYADKDNAIKAINDVGIFQYVEKPWDNNQLLMIIKNGLSNKGLKETLGFKLKELEQVMIEKEKISHSAEAIKEELRIAARIQSSMFPKSIPATNGISISTKYTPAMEVGGDYYDFVMLDEENLAILLADATGHGMMAALSTALVKFAFSTLPKDCKSPEVILKNMNEILFQGLPKELFVAALAAVINTKTGECALANGGIPHPYVFRTKSNKVERIAVNGLLLGFVDGAVFELDQTVTVRLEQNDCLIVYTDGLSETENEKGERFENGHLTSAIENSPEKCGQPLLNFLFESAKEFHRGGPFEDDVTLLGIHKSS